MKPYSKEWFEKVEERRKRFLQQVSHLPLLNNKEPLKTPLEVVELVELTICGEIDPRKNDYLNPQERKPVIFRSWYEQDGEDGGGQGHYDISCGRFIKMPVYVIGRNHNPNDTIFVVYTTVMCENRIPHPDPIVHKTVNAENIGEYRVLERYV